jgi:glucose-1-phosphatase
MVLPVAIHGLTANSDGLYRLEDLDHRMQEAMEEYEAIEDAPNSIPAASARSITPDGDSAYTQGGIPSIDFTLGVVIENKRKLFRK